MKLETLCELLVSKKFHHAEYCVMSNIWKSLYIYKKSETKLCGFEFVGSFGQGNPLFSTAEEMLRGKVISVRPFGIKI